MAEETMDPELFNELVDALGEAVAYHRGAKLDLRTTEFPAPPAPISREGVRKLRSAYNLSQGVFARCLSVSKKLVQAWEAGTRRVEGPALRLLRLGEHHPSLVFPTASRTSSPAASGRRAKTRTGRSGLRRTGHAAAKRSSSGKAARRSISRV